MEANEAQVEMEKQWDGIRALWALIMGHLVGASAGCTCCDMLSSSPEGDAKREEILTIFREMGFNEAIDDVAREYFAGLAEARRKGQWYGWPYKTLPLLEPTLLKRLLADAPVIMEKRLTMP
ncbi:MAG: hypothetical protein WCO25_03360 [Candidatus Uhrbacteria bacterium]